MQDRLIVLNKRSGISCFPYRKEPSRPCMLNELFSHYPAQHDVDWPAGFAGGIAHRLDVSTSGQLLVARTLQDLTALREDFVQKRLCKRYWFLTRTEVSWQRHVMAFAIAHHPKNRRKMVVQRGERTPHRGRWYPAETTFRFLDRVDGLSLWEATMQTGVMHQIRLHAAFAGLALVGDRLYGGGESPDFFPADFALHHVGLHGQHWEPAPVPTPDWWPVWVQKYFVSLG